MLSKYIINDLYKYKVLYKEIKYILENSVIKYNENEIDILNYYPNYDKFYIKLIKSDYSDKEKYIEILKILKLFNLNKKNLQNLKSRLRYIIKDMERINNKEYKSKKIITDKLYNKFSLIKKINYNEIKNQLEDCYVTNSVYKQKLNKCSSDKIIYYLLQKFYNDIYPKWPARTAKKKPCKLCSKLGIGNYCNIHKNKCIYLFKNSKKTIKWPAITFKNKKCKLCEKNLKNIFCTFHRNMCTNIFY